MLIAARNAITGGKKIPARSYVQDGLIAMWDGIENAGWGIHNPNAIVWKDLIGDNDLTVQNGTWGSDGLITPNSNYNVNPAIGSRNAIPLSADIILDINMEYDYSRNTYVLEFGDNNHILTLERNSGFCIRNKTNAFSFDFGMKRLSVHINYSNDRLYVNGIEVTVRGSSNSWVASSGLVLCGYSGNDRPSSSRCYFGKYLAIRPYNRVLNPIEISANYAIDRKRFNLP